MSDWFAYEPTRASNDSIPGNEYYMGMAGADLIAYLPVYITTMGTLLPIVNTEESISNMIGFTTTSAAFGSSVNIFLSGQIMDGFAGLTIGTEYFAYSSGITNNITTISINSWFRSIGSAVSSSKIIFNLGSTVER